LLPKYRGKGLGVLLCQTGEEMVVAHGGIKYIALCAVEREPTHPAKPIEYYSSELLWKKQEFIKHSEITVNFSWKELDQPSETLHKMVFWIKAL
jgi:hypothetical protein